MGEGGGSEVGGAAGAVCRLCGVAAGVAAGRGAGGADQLLEEAVGGSGSGGVADGPCAAGDDELTGGKDQGEAEWGVAAEIERSQPGRGSDAVHDVAGRVPGSAEQVCGTGGCGGRDTDSGADEKRDQRTDRMLCEHAGAADTDRGREELAGDTGAGAGADAGSL